MKLKRLNSTAASSSKFSNKEGFLIIKDYETAITILKDDRFRVPNLHGFIERLELATGNSFPSLKRFIHNSPFFLEGKRHQELRNISLKYFVPGGLKQWDSFISKKIDLIIERAMQKNEFDIIESIGLPIFTEICRPMIGLYPLNIKAFDAKATVLQRLIEPMLSLNNLKRVDQDLGWLLSQIEHPIPTMQNKSDSVYASLLSEALDDFSEEDKTAIAITLYAAVAPLSQTITNILHQLYKDDPDSHKAAVSCDQFADQMEGCLHKAAAPIYIHRIANSDFMIDGFKMNAGNTVMIEIATAFRGDDESCPVPSGNNIQNFAFGYGKHFCIGSHLSKRIISELIPKFLNAFPKLEVIETKADANNHIANALATFTVRRPLI